MNDRELTILAAAIIYAKGGNTIDVSIELAKLIIKEVSIV